MSKTFSRALASFVTALTSFQRPERAERNRLQVRDMLTAQHTIETEIGTLSLVCSNRNEAHYAYHFFDREPEALKWIDAFEGPCTFWDVGANTGIYALYAALSENVDVLAFEPVASSYAALYGNIHANAMDDRVKALCMGFFDETVIGEVRMGDMGAGSAMHEFGNAATDEGKTGDRTFAQRTLTFSIDGFRELYDLPAPDYLKIDVDGVEEQILEGGASTLCMDNLKSILIEISADDEARNRRIFERLESYGFGSHQEFPDEHNIAFYR